MLAAVERSARSLLGLGIRAGDRVGILMPNCFDFLETQLACALLGVSAVPVNIRFRAHELEYVLDDSDMVAIATNDLIDEHVDLAALVADAAQSAPPCLRHLIALGRGTRPGSSAARRSSRPAGTCRRPRSTRRGAASALRDEAMMMYTSGTTTNPKGCVLTHEALVRTGVAAAERWQLVHDERFWNPLPMFHMGQVFPLLAHMHVGATLVTSTHFDAGRGAAADRRRADHLRVPDLPGHHADLIRHPDFERTNLGTIRLVNERARPRRCARCRSASPRRRS